MGPEWYNHWDGWQAVMAHAQSLGIDFMGLLYGSATDLNRARYGRGSFLLEWNGSGKSALLWLREGGDNWNSVMDINPGQPLGAKQQVGSAWKRSYQWATVYVNPTHADVIADGHTIPALDALILTN
jgi:hypothetical protein